MAAPVLIWSYKPIRNGIGTVRDFNTDNSPFPNTFYVSGYQMQFQSNLEKTIALLKRHIPDFPEVALLLESNLSPINFFDFAAPSPTTTKEHILDIYEIRASTEAMMQKHSIRKDHSMVAGYDTLLPRLRDTKLEHICVSDIETPYGSCIVFSDFERTELIGVLVSK